MIIHCDMSTMFCDIKYNLQTYTEELYKNTTTDSCAAMCTGDTEQAAPTTVKKCVIETHPCAAHVCKYDE